MIELSEYFPKWNVQTFFSQNITYIRKKSPIPDSYFIKYESPNIQFQEEIKKMIADIDKDGTGKISYEDFLELMSIKMAEKDSREEILKAFRQ